MFVIVIQYSTNNPGCLEEGEGEEHCNNANTESSIDDFPCVEMEVYVSPMGHQFGVCNIEGIARQTQTDAVVPACSDTLAKLLVRHGSLSTMFSAISTMFTQIHWNSSLRTMPVYML